MSQENKSIIAEVAYFLDLTLAHAEDSSIVADGERYIVFDTDSSTSALISFNTQGETNDERWERLKAFHKNLGALIEAEEKGKITIR